MPNGAVDEGRTEQYLPLSNWCGRRLKRRWTSRHQLCLPRPGALHEYRRTGQRLGFITPLTHNFCESCNRCGSLHRHAVYVPGPGRCSGSAYAAAATASDTALDACHHEAISPSRKAMIRDDRRHSRPAVARPHVRHRRLGFSGGGWPTRDAAQPIGGIFGRHGPDLQSV